MAYLYSLTTEKLTVAYGIDAADPRFSWKISSDKKGTMQTSYEITVKCSCGKTVWESGKVDSSSNLVRYAGEALKPIKKYTWHLKSTLNDGEVIEESADFMTGLLGSDLFDKASWISLPKSDLYTKKTVPAFRKEFDVTAELRSASLVIVGCGVYAGYINGERLYNVAKDGTHQVYELTPGFTEPDFRKLYHTYDVTPMLRSGKNCISAVVTSGWYSDQIVEYIGGYSTLRALLVLEYTDGKCEMIATDNSWKVSADEHPIRLASIYEGQDYDARICNCYAKAGFDDKNWLNAEINDEFKGVVSAHIGAPLVCRPDLERKAVKVYTYNGVKDTAENVFGTIDNVTYYDSADFVLKKGDTAVIDFAQNASGREKFKVIGKAGTTITIRHGEMLNDGNGQRSRGNDGPEGSVYLENLRGIRAATKYTIGKDDTAEKFAPYFSFYGFRYVTVTADDDVHFTDFTAEVITSIDHDNGTVECGDKYVNRLIDNAKWGMYSNYLSIPTDCPQRDERLGWTADTQVFTTTAQYFSSSASSFHEKWAQDLRDSQYDTGAYKSVAPTGRGYAENGGALGWADAGILTPYYVWKMTGDTKVFEGHYESMKHYMEYLASRGTAGPLGTFGDWLSFDPNNKELTDFLGICFYAWDAELMSVIAKELGHDADAKHYADVFEAEKKVFIETYVNENGEIKLPQQTAALYALKLGLLPDEKSKEAVKAQLKKIYEENGYLLQTGFLGTAILLPTLSDLGMNDIAYKLLLQDKLPSWLYSVKAGATTIWERWNSYSIEKGFGDVGMNSFNHYAYGCVAEWLFSYMAGIKPETYGFSKFILAPIPDKSVGYAKAEYDSESGLIKSEWKYDGDKVLYTCTVPANTTATLINPKTGEKTALVSGDYTFEW